MSGGLILGLLLAVLGTSCKRSCSASNDASLLNVSYDPTREVYQELNGAFAQDWKAKRAQTITVRQSHAGSAKQARSVIDGLDADVVTLALGYDVDALARAGLIARDWQTRLPNGSCPYVSTIVFVVRKGNPKSIKDWADLTRKEVRIVVANPKTSGGARWTYLAAFGWALLQPDGTDERAREFVKALYANVAVLAPGARGATTTFSQTGIGDVLLSWESEAHLLEAEARSQEFEIIVPSLTILAEPPVAWVDKNVKRHRTRELAEAYLRYLYTEEGQEIVARHYFRPRSAAVLAKHRSAFPDVKTFTIDEVFGGWEKAHQEHFADGAAFDKLTARR